MKYCNIAGPVPFLRLLRLLGVTVFLSLTIGCTAAIIHHEPAQAVRVAVEFAKAAWVHHDYANASQWVTNDDSSGSKTKEISIKLHPDGICPIYVKATAWEPVPGTPTIKIFIDGTSPDRKVFHYYLVLVQDGNTYKVQDVFRSADDTPFQKTNLTQNL